MEGLREFEITRHPIVDTTVGFRKKTLLGGAIDSWGGIGYLIWGRMNVLSENAGWLEIWLESPEKGSEPIELSHDDQNWIKDKIFGSGFEIKEREEAPIKITTSLLSELWSSIPSHFDVKDIVSLIRRKINGVIFHHRIELALREAKKSGVLSFDRDGNKTYKKS